MSIPKKQRVTWNLANTEYLDTFSEFSHWIDWLTYSFWDSLHDKMNSYLLWWIYINDTNTNILMTRLDTDEVFTVERNSTSNGSAFTFSLMFETISVPVFQFVIFGSDYKNAFNVTSALKFYGSYYRLLSLDWIPVFLINKINDLTSDALISRLDYRFDYLDKRDRKFPDINTILPHKRSNKKRRPYYTWDTLESWDCWKKTNKTVFIRMYNKNLELEKKLKWLFLYGDIVSWNYKSFYRLEYELWQKFCSWYSWKELKDLLQKVFSLCWIKESSFSWTYYKPKRFVDLKNELDRNRYVRIFKSMAQNLKNNWIDPSILFTEWDKNDITDLDIINNIEKSIELLWIDGFQIIRDLKTSLYNKDKDLCE